MLNFDIKTNIENYHKEISKYSNHRFRSWEHCYHFFQTCRPINNSEDCDLAALHLAFYLASWGMYRGSSKLLQRDYKVHTSVVMALMTDSYAELWHLNFDAINSSSSEVERVWELGVEAPGR